MKHCTIYMLHFPCLIVPLSDCTFEQCSSFGQIVKKIKWQWPFGYTFNSKIVFTKIPNPLDLRCTGPSRPSINWHPYGYSGSLYDCVCCHILNLISWNKNKEICLCIHVMTVYQDRVNVFFAPVVSLIPFKFACRGSYFAAVRLSLINYKLYKL